MVKHKLSEQDIPLINNMIANWKTYEEIARHFGVHINTFYKFKSENKDKIGKRDYSYNLSKKDEENRKQIINAYTSIYYNSLLDGGLNPDKNEIESLLSMDTIICACKYNPQKNTKYTTYCISSFKWTMSKYTKKLLQQVP